MQVSCDAGIVYEQFVSQVSFALVNEFVDGLVLHAACVQRGTACVLIAGKSGAGKTTAAAWFLGRGYSYLTDELVFVPFASSQVHGWARPLHVKRGAFAMVTAQQRGPDQQPWLHYPGGAFVMPQNFAARVSPRATPTHMLFAHYNAHAETRVIPLAPARAAPRLLQHLVNARNLPNHGVTRLIQLCRHVKAYEAHYAQLDDVAERVGL